MIRNDFISYFISIISLTTLLSATGCTDELLYDESGRFIEGTATLNVSVSYDAETGLDLDTRALPSPTGGDSGTSISKISHLVMIVYDKDGNLLKKYNVVAKEKPNPDADISNVKINNFSDNRTDDEKSNNNQDTKIGRVDYQLTLAAGQYYIYAVANMPDIDKYDISTRDKLKSISIGWDSSDMSKNSQMFGIYSIISNRDASDMRPVTVSADYTQLHCWVRRLASKVTVAFDGSELYDDVQVYIDSVKIKDIPRACTLGFDNEVGKDADGKYIDHSKANRQKLLTDGKTVVYQNLNNQMLVPENLFHVCNGRHKYFSRGDDTSDTNPSVIDNIHTNDYAHSLFFFENKQGTGKSKRQSQNGSVIDYPNWKEGNIETGWKDNKPFGTYVEVTGMYRCFKRDGKTSSGRIIYRFMLGQDTEKDYNATRNTHYKLTLKFRGYGNDADWHIEYAQKPGIHVLSPQYISYLYNKKMMATVKVIGEIDPDRPYLYAMIVGTEDADAKAQIPDPGEAMKKANEEPYNTYWRPYGHNGNLVFPEVESEYLSKISVVDYVDGPWSSFLSLKEVSAVKIEVPGFEGVTSKLTDFKTNYNKTYFEERDYGWRIYDTAEGTHSTAGGIYSVVNLNRGPNDVVTERLFNIPLFTRAKELITKTGFSGNNPFSEYARCERIRLCAYMKDETGKYSLQTSYLDIIQVPRVENPKAVWRKGGSTETFEVTLACRKPGKFTSEAKRNEMLEQDFHPVISDGRWSAEVYSGDDIVTLSATSAGTGLDNDKLLLNKTRIEGESGYPVNFTINFNGNKGFAIVRVRYNNYTCEHDIFCRNGHEDDVELIEGGPKWCSRNVYRFDGTTPVMTDSPLEQGSFFRRGSYTAILEDNDNQYGVGVVPSKLISIDNKNVRDERTWSNLQCADANIFKKWAIGGDDHIATSHDFYTLVSQSNMHNPRDINKAYGVLYGDGAKKTQMSHKIACGYTRQDGTSSEKGMRGVIVYNPVNSRQLFLPIGATGFGRRKGATWENEGNGVLRYAGRKSKNVGGLMPYNPLFFDIYARPGAIYWCRSWYDYRKPYGNDENFYEIEKSSDFDINYFTMGFEGFDEQATASRNTKTGYGNNDVNGSKSSGCFLRIVRGPAVEYP